VRRWLAVRPDEASALAWAGAVEAQEAGGLDAARARFEQALKRQPRQALALAGMGYVQYGADKPAEAIRLFDEAVRAGESTGYADAAGDRLREAQGESAWTDRFHRPTGDALSPERDWVEHEGEGILIQIASNRLRFDGVRHGKGGRTTLARREPADRLLRIETTLDVPDVNDAIVGLRLASARGDAELLFGFNASRRLVYAYTPARRTQPLEFTPISVPGQPSAAPLGRGRRVVLRIGLISRRAGSFQLFGEGDLPLLPRPVELKALANSSHYDVGLFAQTNAGRRCLFFAERFKVVRRRAK